MGPIGPACRRVSVSGSVPGMTSLYVMSSVGQTLLPYVVVLTALVFPAIRALRAIHDKNTAAAHNSLIYFVILALLSIYYTLDYGFIGESHACFAIHLLYTRLQ